MSQVSQVNCNSDDGYISAAASRFMQILGSYSSGVVNMQHLRQKYSNRKLIEPLKVVRADIHTNWKAVRTAKGRKSRYIGKRILDSPLAGLSPSTQEPKYGFFLF